MEWLCTAPDIEGDEQVGMTLVPYIRHSPLPPFQGEAIRLKDKEAG